MSNPFATWTAAEVVAHNARISKQFGAGGGVDRHATTASASEAWPGEEPNQPGVACATQEGHSEAELQQPSPARPSSWTVPGPPVPAPRMTQRDKWLKPPRQCVQAYWDYRDRLRRVVGNVPVPVEVRVKFFISMPTSWSGKKRYLRLGELARSGFDVDNCVKSVLDALWKHDAGVARIVAEKRWCLGTGSTEITIP
jgi:Holliday junction resolvase RusA-like endonuclease